MNSEEKFAPHDVFTPIDWTTTKGIGYYIAKWAAESNTEDIECEIVDPLQLPSSEETKTESPNSI